MKTYARLMIASAVLATVALFSGCASVPLASSATDSKSKEFQPLPDRASVYIYRNENFGAAISMTVSLNKLTLGQTAAETYFHVNVPPGRYTVESISENVSSVTLNLDAGKNYFVWQEVKMGMWSGRSALQQVDDAKGRAGVLECKEIASTIAESELHPTVAPLSAPPPAATSNASNFQEELKKLDELHAAKQVTDEEYTKMRASLVAKFAK